ncbi:hypothetical protein BDW59DRAFT_161085 [Aspergillus cavernicola]|uniref:Transcription factor domain-containing protein n=1 Tax=Aspergillus cavernicola TaxID=176166 RepID=A0ABR4IET5_9EURO
MSSRYLVPEAHDACRTSIIDIRFLQAFEQALPSRSRPSHFDSDHDTLSLPSGPVSRMPQNDSLVPILAQELSYPMETIYALPELPPQDVVSQLVGFCARRFMRQAPFFRELRRARDVEQNQEENKLSILSMATLGTIVTMDPNLIGWGARLWESAIDLYLAVNEANHRMTRGEDWLISSLMLATYAIMKADGRLWSVVNTLNGQVTTTVRRLASESESSRGRISSAWEVSRTISYCFLIDTLRSIMLDIPASLHSADLTIHLSTDQTFHEVYNTQLISNRTLPSTLNQEDHLLIILALLSDIIHLHHWLGPLVDVNIRNGGQPRFPDPSSLLKGEYGMEDPRTQCANVFLPFSASMEWIRCIQTVQNSLASWRQSVEGNKSKSLQGSHASVASIMALYYFCQLILSGGSEVLTLPQQLGYSPNQVCKPRGQRADTRFPHVSDETTDSAWKVLDLLGAVKATGKHDDVDHVVEPVWLPMVVFYGGLVVWTSLQRPAQGPMAGPRTPKLVRLFEMELRDMVWPCATTMADFLKNLMGENV